MGQRKNSESPRGTELQTWIPLSNALPMGHRDSMVRTITKFIYMTNILHTARTSNVDDVKFCKYMWNKKDGKF